MKKLIFPGVAALGLLAAAPGQAQVFELIHPEVQKDTFEFESLNGVSVSDVDSGDTRSAHEIALGYAPLSFWKPTFAVEIENAAGEPAEIEAFEFENVFLLPFGEGRESIFGDGGDGHGHGHSHGTGGFSYTLAIYSALEIPNEGGLNTGAVAVGPIAEVNFGGFQAVANFFFEVPFEDGEDTGLEYALGVTYPVADTLRFGFEAFGDVEGALGDGPALGDTEHSIGPAIYGDFDIGKGRVLEPRLAVLFGVTDEAPDAVVSANIELKF